MAFYNNYESKDNLLRQIIYFQTNLLIERIGSPFREKTNVEWYVKMFECIKENNIYNYNIIVIHKSQPYKLSKHPFCFENK